MSAISSPTVPTSSGPPAPAQPHLLSTSDALVEYSSYILEELDDLHKVEYNKKGRKYRFVSNNGGFQRVRQEDKHLIVYPEDPTLLLSFYSAYLILYNINQGEIFKEFPSFCCTILGLAKSLESNHWYEEENSSVLHLKNSKVDPRDVVLAEADAFVRKHPITDEHVRQGINLLICSKLNFLHTDHHVGTKLEGYYLRLYIEEYFGEEALASHDVLVALKSCVHWGNIKGVLYKLDVPHIATNDELVLNFASFPDPSQELKDNVYERYPSGTSKYSLLKKSIDLIAESKYARLIHLDPDVFDVKWLYQLCHDIEVNPIKYHLRSKAKSLYDEEPVNLAELGAKNNLAANKLFQFISLVINFIPTEDYGFLLQNSKIPKVEEKLIEENEALYHEMSDLAQKVEAYEKKLWDTGDIVARLQQDINWSVRESAYNQIMGARHEYENGD
ncbi:uncharacterized protein LODBEIA_P58840 [Lodderomyces beijingensis]|uniref:Uncharacterized protein n=1 Tax=Lodderomyces beijingensis TaxID=1775926 RepID=A0ABP0ZVX7_9ASCO